MTLCTICYNFEYPAMMTRYEPTLSIGNECARCGDSALEERIGMGLAESADCIVECRFCESKYFDDDITEHHFHEHPGERFDPAWYYDS